jgi:hypothetical protein
MPARISRPTGLVGQAKGWLWSWISPPDAPSAAVSPTQRIGLMLILVLVTLSVVAVHQLTPFALLAVMTALVVFGRTSLRTMPLLVLAATVAWIVYMADTYLAGHISEVTGHVFQLGSTVNQNVGSRLAGSPQHVLVVHAALLTTAAVFGLAALGALRSMRHGYRDLTYILLIVAPFGLLGLQSYDGEGLLRVYLYALPGFIFFAAALFFTKPTLGRSWRATVMILLVSEALIGAFYLCRYGNERMDHVTSAELATLNRLYDVAPRGSIFIASADNTPWRYEGYARYTYDTADDPQSPTFRPLIHGNVNAAVHQIQAELTDPRYPRGYILFLPTEAAYAEMFGVYPPGTYAALERAIAHSPEFHAVFQSSGGVIFAPRGTGGGSG